MALLSLSFFGGRGRAFILDEEIFSYRSLDPLAARSDYGPLHQMPSLNATDFRTALSLSICLLFQSPSNWWRSRLSGGAAT